MMHGRGCIVVLLSCFCVAVASGCSGGDKVRRVTVEGVVTYKGEPANEVLVGFVDDSGAVSIGKTDDEGKFKISAVPVGNLAVTVRSPKPGAENDEPVTAPTSVNVRDYRVERTKRRKTESATEKVAGGTIPAKYNGVKSGLTATVKNGSENFFQFNLE